MSVQIPSVSAFAGAHEAGLVQAYESRALPQPAHAGPTSPANRGEPPAADRIQAGASRATSPDRWQPEDRAKIDALIDGALKAHHGNVDEAWKSLVEMRQDPKNFYDHNLADAADCLRARWETARYGPEVEKLRVDAYLELKQHGLIPRAGPGPVSPYSDIQREYMYQGIRDGLADLKAAGKEPPNPILGAARAANDGGIEGEGGIEEGSGAAAEHETGEHDSGRGPTTLLGQLAAGVTGLLLG